MATYTLSGTGIQSLSASVVALTLTVTTLPAASGNGGANPADYYGLGTLRAGNPTAFWEPFTIVGGPQWIPLPYGSTRLGYAFLNGAAASVVEVFGSSPLAFPLSTLPDVSLASPVDAQVLAYQATTSKWINATPAGSGVTPGIVKYDEVVLAAATGGVTLPQTGSFPSSWRTIQVRWQGRCSAALSTTNVNLQLNGDTANNYDWENLLTTGATVGGSQAQGAAAMRVGDVTAASAGNAAMAATGELWINNYVGTTWWKEILGQSGANWGSGANQVQVNVQTGVWRSTAAVTSLRIFPATGNWTIGSVFTVYLL